MGAHKKNKGVDRYKAEVFPFLLEQGTLWGAQSNLSWTGCRLLYYGPKPDDDIAIPEAVQDHYAYAQHKHSERVRQWHAAEAEADKQPPTEASQRMS